MNGKGRRVWVLLKISILIASMIICSTVFAETKVVAHRGASHDAPENTLAAFELAWEQGADAIECDVWMTQDSELVCIHDRMTKRTAGTQLDVTKSTLTAIRKLDVGRWKGKKWVGQRIPALKEVMATVPQGKKIFVEIKGGPEIVPLLRSLVKRVKMSEDSIVIISFDKDVVSKAKKSMPGIKTLLLVDYERSIVSQSWKPSPESVVKTVREIKADGVDIHALERMDAEFIKKLRAAGEVHAWTINDLRLATRLWEFRIDSITTDKPKVVKGLVDSLVRSKQAKKDEKRGKK